MYELLTALLAERHNIGCEKDFWTPGNTKRIITLLREIDNGEYKTIESPAHHIIAKIDGGEEDK